MKFSKLAIIYEHVLTLSIANQFSTKYIFFLKFF